MVCGVVGVRGTTHILEECKEMEEERRWMEERILTRIGREVNDYDMARRRMDEVVKWRGEEELRIRTKGWFKDKERRKEARKMYAKWRKKRQNEEVWKRRQEEKREYQDEDEEEENRNMDEEREARERRQAEGEEEEGDFFSTSTRIK